MRCTLLLSLLVFIACNQRQNRSTTNRQLHVSHEVWTIYNRHDSVCNVKRLLSNDSNFILYSYNINTAEPEAVRQTFIKKELLNKGIADTVAASKDFNWRPFKARPVLFVQLKAKAFKDEWAALEKGHEVEEQISNRLKAAMEGASAGSDVGPGGANILFEVNDINKAIPIILKVLQQEEFDQSAIIGRRVNTSADDWFYEVIYPANFTGAFITM